MSKSTAKSKKPRKPSAAQVGKELEESSAHKEARTRMENAQSSKTKRKRSTVTAPSMSKKQKNTRVMTEANIIAGRPRYSVILRCIIRLLTGVNAVGHAVPYNKANMVYLTRWQIQLRQSTPGTTYSAMLEIYSMTHTT
ncbi:hypothetical protein PHMEG_0009415 [Phytophthora megakarya]|uniref:Uncharacterized protein n=1 Tax=Phytophthora megakarya TaxID=4795 RepID=A0A225WI10_9STRA|nr:hypothetical protein PHMEG_0009415 [Phytophthora megakarya]